MPGETNTANDVFSFNSILVTIPGDVNGDRTVNVLDLIMIATRLGQSNGGGNPPYSNLWYKWMNCDLKTDNKINVLDLIACATHLGQHW